MVLVRRVRSVSFESGNFPDSCVYYFYLLFVIRKKHLLPPPSRAVHGGSDFRPQPSSSCLLAWKDIFIDEPAGWPFICNPRRQLGLGLPT